MRQLFWVSFVANLFLLTTLTLARVDPVHRQATDSVSAIAPADFLQSIGAGAGTDSVAGFVGKLTQSGLSSEQINSATLGWLRYSLDGETAWPGYWQSAWSPAQAELRNRMQNEELVRATLLELFGAAATQEQAFAPVFKPLGPAFSFLTSEAQIALQAQQLDALKASESERAGLYREAVVCELVGSARQTTAGIPDAFSEQEAFEYALRFSAPAAQLRLVWKAPDEQAFRDAFSEVQKLNSTVLPAGQLAIRDRIRELIGQESFARFWSMRDPLYQALSDTLSAQGQHEGLVAQAYAIVLRAQESLLSVIGPDPLQVDPESIRRVKAREHQALSALLGAEAAEDLAAAMNLAAMKLGSSERSRC